MGAQSPRVRGSGKARLRGTPRAPSKTTLTLGLGPRAAVQVGASLALFAAPPKSLDSLPGVLIT